MSGKWIRIVALMIWGCCSLTSWAQTDAGLVGWWQMDGLFDGIAVDSSGYEHHGLILGDPAWVEGLLGQALQFDGSDDYVDCGAHAQLNVLDDVTVTAWIKPGDNNQDRKLFGNMGANGGFKLAIYKNNKVELAVRDTSGQVVVNRNVNGGTVIPAGTWVHVAGVYSVQGQTLTTYVNGQIDRSLPLDNMVMGVPAESFKIGRDPATAGYYFNGAMDEVRVYNRVLTDTEIAQLAFSQGSGNNDTCQHAEAIGDIDGLAFDTSEATFDGEGMVMTSPNLWYCYTATCTGTVTVSLCGSVYDTMVAVYKGCNCTQGSSVLLTFNDDFCGLQSQVTFDAVAGDSYLIEVGGYANRSGQGTMTVNCAGKQVGDFDLGDAPDSTNDIYASMTAYTVDGVGIPGQFPTTFLGNGGKDPQGPLHLDPLSLAHLGQSVSLEIESYKGLDEDGINNIDPYKDVADQDGADDGLMLPVSMPACDWTSLEYTVSVIDSETPFWVNIWCDWNRDGDWDDDLSSDPNLNHEGISIDEWAVKNQYFSGRAPGLHLVQTPGFRSWHPSEGPAELWLRITLSESPWTEGNRPGELGNAGSGPQEGYAFGETEDYLVIPESECVICEDLNDDGIVDLDDLWVLLDQWLNLCLYGPQ